MTKKQPPVFGVHLKELTSLLQESRKKKNPAYWLYENKARKPLFMLESIMRLLGKITADKSTKQWKKFFKSLEDALGDIDHYDMMIRQFSPVKGIKKEIIAYYKIKLGKSMRQLNDELMDNDFYLPLLQEFPESYSIEFSEDLISAIRQQIDNEIHATAVLYQAFQKPLTKFEKQIHELRRKIRWTSIYGEAFQGLIVLKNPRKKYEWEKEFAPKVIRDSPFTSFPVKKGFAANIIYNQKSFYALCYVVDSLGKIKDKGLALEALEKAIRKTSAGPADVSDAAELLSYKKSEEELLEEAYQLLEKYFVTYKIHLELLKV